MKNIPNINCLQYNKGGCNDLSRMGNGCVELSGEICNIREPHPKPPAPPPPPPKRIIREDVKIEKPKWPNGPEIVSESDVKIHPLTEGKVRGGMSSQAMRKTFSRPVHPPMPGKKDVIRSEILEKVEKKEFIKRCVAVDTCPTCGYTLRESSQCGKICDKCNLLFDC